MRMKITNITVPAAKYTRESVLAFRIYPETRGLALLLVDRKSYRDETTASVNVESYGAPKPPQGEVWLKGWSENTGIPKALVDAGVVELTGDIWITGYVEAQQARLIGHARDLALAFLEAENG